MSDFETYYNELLNEYGLGDTIASKAGQKFGALGTKLKAKMGSEVAKGELDTRDETNKIYTSFKRYCGQQKIDMSRELCAEDFVDFLIHQLEFHIEDPQQFIYKQPVNPQVKTVLDKVEAALSDGVESQQQQESFGKPMGWLFHQAEKGDATARFGLWFLYRKYEVVRTMVRTLPQTHNLDIAHAVGKALDKTQLMRQIEAVAKLRLKRMKGGAITGGAGGGKGKKKAPEQPDVATDENGKPDLNVKQGMRSAVELHAHAKKWDHEAFDPTDGVFAKAGLKNIKKVALDLCAAASANDEKVFGTVRGYFKGMPPMKQANIARMLLEFFRTTNMHKGANSPLQPAFTKFSTPAGDTDSEENSAAANFQNKVLGIFSLMHQDQYDADEVNRQIMTMFPGGSAGNLIIALLMCLGEAYSDALGAGPGA